MEQQRRQTYEERFLAAYGRLERPLLKLVMISFALVMIAQLILAVPGGRALLSAVERLEGERASTVLPTAAANKDPATVILRTVGVDGGALPKAWVKLNGVSVSAFTKPEVKIRVKEGDVLTVDTSAIPGLYRFEVDHDEPLISYPIPGTFIEASESRSAEVGPVHFLN